VEESLLNVETRQRTRWITINRPDKLNALNSAVLEALETVLTAAASDGDVAVVVISGAGGKAFVAGADIAAMQGFSAAEGREFARRGQRVFELLERSPKPVIAAINGFALGGGLELALACHLRVASELARFGQPEVKLGLIPGFGGTQRLPRLIGRGRALQLLLTGEMVDAATALSWGLVDRVIAGSDLPEAVQKLADTMTALSPTAIRHCLEAVNSGAECPLEVGLELEAALFGVSFATGDMKEGVAAFLEKRTPVFPGS